MSKLLGGIKGLMIFLVALSLGLTGCGGGGGGGGGSTGSTSTTTTTKKTTISGTVSPPAGVSKDSLTIVALGNETALDSSGTFSTDVYKDGVSAVAAMPPNKAFGLMNIVATTSGTTTTAGVTEEHVDVFAAFKEATSNSVTLDANTTAVSMVFLTPYFHTSDPAKAKSLISIIQNDPKVSVLANVIDSVFNESDPMEDPTLQSALDDAVRSVLDTIQANLKSSGTSAKHETTSPKILYLPKRSGALNQNVIKSVATSYTIDTDYIRIKTTESSGSYNIYIDSRQGNAVDWIGEIDELDPSQFSSLSDLQTKAKDRFKTYTVKSAVGIDRVSAKGYLKWVDFIGNLIDLAFNYFTSDGIKVSSSVDAVYIVRAFSGGGWLSDSTERTFLSQVYNGTINDNKAFELNVISTVLDTISVAIDLSIVDDTCLSGVIQDVLDTTFKSAVTFTAVEDLIDFAPDVSYSIVHGFAGCVVKDATKNFLGFLGKVVLKSAKEATKWLSQYKWLEIGSTTGEVIERSVDLFYSATPLESEFIVVGTPFGVDVNAPSVPLGLKASVLSSSSIALSWTASTDDVGVSGYNIYRDGVLVGSSTTTSYTDTGLNASTQYCYTVSAFDAAGNESGKSSQACATTQLPDNTPPSVPSGLSASAVSSSRIDLTWSASTDDVGVSGYNIYRDGVLAGSSSTTSYNDTGLNASTRYCYSVSAFDAAGNESGKSSQACATTYASTVSTWIKTYGGAGDEAASSIQQTTDGGYIVAGSIYSYGSGYTDLWVLKLDSSGGVVWQKTYGGAYWDSASSIYQTTDGGYIVAGGTQSSGFDYDAWVLKLDAGGNITWQKTYGSFFWDYVSSIQQTTDGGYIVAGDIYDGNHSDAWVAKLDVSGNVTWQKTYGGTGSDSAWSIEQTTDGGYIVAGLTNSYGKGNSDLWVLKLDAGGNVTWEKSYGGAGNDRAYSIEQTKDGGYIVAGETSSYGAGDSDFWVLRLDASGNVTWQRAFGGSYFDEAYSIQQTTDGGYIVAGYYSYSLDGTKYPDLWVLKLDAGGNVTWQKSYGGGASYWDDAWAVRQTADGGYIVAGVTDSFGAGSGDFWVLKLDGNGDIGGSCGLGAATNATVTDTTVTPVDTTATVTDTAALVTTTTVVPQDTTATTATQCSSP